MALLEATVFSSFKDVLSSVLFYHQHTRKVFAPSKMEAATFSNNYSDVVWELWD